MVDSDHANAPSHQSHRPYDPPNEIGSDRFSRPRRWPIVILIVLGLGLMGFAGAWLLAPMPSVRGGSSPQDNVLQHVKDFGEIRTGSLEDEYQ